MTSTASTFTEVGKVIIIFTLAILEKIQLVTVHTLFSKLAFSFIGMTKRMHISPANLSYQNSSLASFQLPRRVRM